MKKESASFCVYKHSENIFLAKSSGSLTVVPLQKHDPSLMDMARDDGTGRRPGIDVNFLR